MTGVSVEARSSSRPGAHRRLRALLVAAATALFACATTWGQSAVDPPVGGDHVERAAERTAERDVERNEDPFAPPTRALDERIDDSKMTVLPPPTRDGVNAVRPAGPPVLRIATTAEACDLDEAAYERARAAITRGIDALRARQSVRGAWLDGGAIEPTDGGRAESVTAAVTGLGVKALAQDGIEFDDPALARGLEFILLELDRSRGVDAIGRGGLGTYVVSSILMGLASARSPLVVDRIDEAVAWLRDAQWDQSEGVRPEQDWFGGAGYGSHGRPDLSNTQMMLDALHDAGVSPDDPAVQRALAFVSRTQNRKASNPADWAQAGADDGGFVYTPANDGESFGSQAAGEGRYGESMPEGAVRSLRSYGSMTYAGFKSLLYAGLSHDDPRVAAALEWMRAHWTVTENPGLGQQGYFYYMHAMARALQASGLETLTDGDGTSRAWRIELIDALAARQRADGTWRNEQERWLEAEPDLATIYAILALQETLKPRP